MSTPAILGGKPVRTAPYPDWPVYDRTDADAVAGAVLGGVWSNAGADNPIRAFEREFAEYQSARHGIAVTSGTAALEVALLAAGVGPGDEVILPPYTFIATAMAVAGVGAAPVFADIEADTYNIDPARIEEAITSRTRAILPVHFGGRACEMERIQAIAVRHDLAIVEDACHGWGARWRGRGLGSLGTAGAFSFQATKNLNSGEGGMVLTDDPAVARRAERFRGGGDGGAPEEVEADPILPRCYRISALQAALLRSQMHRLESQTQVRCENAEYLTQRLRETPGMAPLREHPDSIRSSVHVYIWRYLASAFDGLPRTRFLEALEAEGIPVAAGYTRPLHRHPLFLKAKSKGERSRGAGNGWFDGNIDYGSVSMPVAERLTRDETVWMFQSAFLGTRADMDDVIAAINKIHDHAAALMPAAATA